MDMEDNFKELAVSDIDGDKLEELKKHVQDWVDYWGDNNRNFVRMVTMICKTSITSDMQQKLDAMNRAPIEFNQMEQFVNAQLGEFANQQPSFEVKVSDTVEVGRIDENMRKTAEIIEGHLRYMLQPGKTDNISYNTFADMLRGGFAVWGIFSKYAHPMSFSQVIDIERCNYPTACGFDISAKMSHKGDGKHCWKIEAYVKDEAEKMFGKEALKDVTYSTSMQGFSWAYRGSNKDVIVFCEFYEKEMKPIKIVQIEDGTVMMHKEYKALLKQWDEEMFLEDPPQIINSRETEIPCIYQYVFNQGKILSKKETDFDHLPYVMFTGGSVFMQNEDGTDRNELTRSYVQNLIGAQDLMNIAGQGVAYEIENTISHKFMADIDTIDLTQSSAWRNVQQANVLLYRSKRTNSDEPLPPPTLIQRGEIPSIIPQTFSQASQSMQQIMGAMDQMAMQSQNISGHAADTGAMQSSRSASPQWQGYITSLSHVATILTCEFPKRYEDARVIPVIDSEGKVRDQVINNDDHPESVSMQYDPYDFKINITVGVNTEVHKRISVNQFIQMAKAGPMYEEFVNTKCLPQFVDNLDMRHIDIIKEKAEEFMKEKQMQKQAASQKPQMDPVQATMMIEQAKLQQKDRELQTTTALKASELELKNREVDLDTAKLLIDAENDQQENLAKSEKAQSENVRSHALLAIELSKHGREKKSEMHDRVERVLVHHDNMSHEKKKLDLEHKKLQASKQPVAEVAVIE